MNILWWFDVLKLLHPPNYYTLQNLPKCSCVVGCLEVDVTTWDRFLQGIFKLAHLFQLWLLDTVFAMSCNKLNFFCLIQNFSYLRAAVLITVFISSTQKNNFWWKLGKYDWIQLTQNLCRTCSCWYWNVSHLWHGDTEEGDTCCLFWEPYRKI